MPKPKVAFYWCASCGGCEETVVDLAEDILGVVEKVDIVLWPVAMDFKYKAIRPCPTSPSPPRCSTAPSARPSRRRWPICSAARACISLPTAPAPTRRDSRAGQPVPARTNPPVQLRGRDRDGEPAENPAAGEVRRPWPRRACPPSITSSAPSTRWWRWTTTCPAARPPPN